MRRNTIADVLAKVEADPNGGCWLWSGVTNPGGYGMVKWDSHPVLVHRLVYEHLVGPPTPGLQLCHRCDVRACCNPGHLFEGTAKQNMRDRDQKGRGYRGQRAWTAKLDRAVVVGALGQFHAGVPQREIARRLGLKAANVHVIVHRQTWRDISMEEIAAASLLYQSARSCPIGAPR